MEACANTYLTNQHLAEQDALSAKAERIDELKERRAKVLAGSMGDFIEALQEATYLDSPKWVRAQVAFVNSDHAELGRVLAELIQSELESMSEEWAEGEYQIEIKNGYGEA